MITHKRSIRHGKINIWGCNMGWSEKVGVVAGQYLRGIGGNGGVRTHGLALMKRPLFH